MLIVWHEALIQPLRIELVSVDPRVVYWPRSHYGDPILDWWISFSTSQKGLIWLLRHSDYSEVIFQT